VVPAWLQKVALAAGAPIGKAMGYGSTYLQQPKPYTPAGKLQTA
jgi:hypothetical protein